MLEQALSTSDYRAILATLEAVERATPLERFRETVTAALEEHMGYPGSIFFIGDPPDEQLQPTDGVLYGYDPHNVEEYVERWRRYEAFDAPRARMLLMRDGVADLHDFYDVLDRDRRRYVHDFLRPRGVEAQMALYIDTGMVRQGFLSLLGRPGTRFTIRDRARLLALRPHLANLLSLNLQMRGEPAFRELLSAREAQVADLVALGRRNVEIAEALGVSEATVKKHVTSALRKLRLTNRTELAAVWRPKRP